MGRLAIKIGVVFISYVAGYYLGYRACFDRWWTEQLRNEMKKYIEDDLK